MRAALALDGLLAGGCEVTVLVAPVSAGTLDPDSLGWAKERCRQALVARVADSPTAALGWLASDRGRRLLETSQPLPLRARLSDPGLLDRAEMLGDAEGFDAVWVLRTYLAGAVAALDRGPGNPRLVLDADEDDAHALNALASLHRLRGETERATALDREARAHARFAAATLGCFDRVLVASTVEAERVRRQGADAEVLPNAVDVPALNDRHADGPAPPELLFVGNLDYLPNRDAVERLTDALMPRLLTASPAAVLHVVGGRRSGDGGPTGQPVVHHGRVDRLDHLYRRATAVVTPLRAGGGTRIKILEAFALGVPVVSTTKGVEGLAVSTEAELLVADTDEEIVRSVLRLAGDRALARALVERAHRFVRRHHDRVRVAERVTALAGLTT